MGQPHLQDLASVRQAVHVVAWLVHAQCHAVQQDHQHADTFKPRAHRVKDKTVGTEPWPRGQSAPWNVTPPPTTNVGIHPLSWSPAPPGSFPEWASARVLKMPWSQPTPLTTDMATHAKPHREPKPHRAPMCQDPHPAFLAQPESFLQAQEGRPPQAWLAGHL